MLRSALIPLLLLALLLVSAPSPAAGPGLRVFASKQEHTTEGSVEVKASPAEVYAAATDYARWQRLLSDVGDVKLLSGGRKDALVRFTSRALDLTVSVRFSNLENRAIRFVLADGPPGGRCHGEFVLKQSDDGTRTRVTAKLTTYVVGPLSVFVSNTTLREQREAKLRADLGDLARRFSK